MCSKYILRNEIRKALHVSSTDGGSGSGCVLTSRCCRAHQWW
jgi:hypothetical protein